MIQYRFLRCALMLLCVGVRALDTLNLTPVASNIQYNGETWELFEDLSHNHGEMSFVSSSGKIRKLSRYVEQTFDSNGTVPLYLGLNKTEVNLALPDLLAEALLANGEPIETHVRDAVPQMVFDRYRTFVGNVQANDTMFVDEYGDTRNAVRPTDAVEIPSGQGFDFFVAHDGLVGGWMPTIRKVWPFSTGWVEIIIFGDVDSMEPFIIKTWFRTTTVINGKITSQAFSREYPVSPPAQLPPKSEDFYTALLRSADYWDDHLGDVVPLTLPDESWSDMSKHTFGLELMVRAGGVYPKYGFFDRNYAGSEYDGFQDIFTSSVLANLLWGRFDQAQAVITNYFDWFTSDTGAINMRGPEVPQFGLSLSLLATYAQYTGDTALLEKYKTKILAWVKILETLHDESLALPQSDPNFGLIAGWSESDSCLVYPTSLFIAPYWNNNINAARGLKELAKISIFSAFSAEWKARAETMTNQTTSTLRNVIKFDMTPPYVPVLPVTNGTVRECMEITGRQEESVCQQSWSHRVYAEMLQPGILPADLANLTINSMQANGITSLGVVANVGYISPETRDILGFISYGYATALLLLNRVDEFILFLYSHRYHVHSRGAWIASEVAGTAGGAGGENPFCIPAAMTIPILMRLALVLEDPDRDVLYMGRGIPTAWLQTGKLISIQQAPTRWGRVNFSIQFHEQKMQSTINFAEGSSLPAELRVKMTLPGNDTVTAVTVNGVETKLDGGELVLQTSDFGKNITIQGHAN